jgi:copper homeostasis protein
MAGITMEVCCYNLESALNAQAAGADRVELCADRHQGGTTPSYGMLEVVRKHLQLPVFSMIRPRGGDFHYSNQEIEVMMHDIQMSKELAIDGVVMGVLQKDGQVNVPVMKELIDIARPLQVTFHRAFDLTPEPKKSLDDILSLGVDRILTSGQHSSVLEGIEIVKLLVEWSQGRLSVMPGAGINEDNLLQILKQTGAKEFHVSASGTRPSQMEFHKEQVLMGNDESEYTIEVSDEKKIRKFRKIADQLTSNN